MHGVSLQPLPLAGGGILDVFSWTRFRQAFLRRVAGLGAGIFSARLAAGQELQMHDAAGWTIVCRRGAVWITQEADVRDIFLTVDEGFALDRGGLAIVRACRDAVVAIRAPAGRGAARSARGDADLPAADEQAQLNWLRSLYPECGPWNDPASYRKAGLI